MSWPACFLIAVIVLSPIAPRSQSQVAAPPVPMPSTRAADTYAIYSSLIPVGETAGKDWPHELWLIADVTDIAEQPDQPCQPASTVYFGMNPHFAVQAPENYKQDFMEILTDFDARCHDRVILSADEWKTAAPVHLLAPAEQAEFRLIRSHAPSSTSDKYKGAPALYSFTQVYFNAHHTVALVKASLWCGTLCGQGFWIALAKENDHWKQLPGWSRTMVVS